MLDVNGNVIGREAHLPFGEGFAESGTQEKHHFTSYERDNETDLNYAVNRMLDVSVGRFQTADPTSVSKLAIYPQSWNRFSYVRNRVVNRVDPLGLDDDPPSPGSPGNPIDFGSIEVNPKYDPFDEEFIAEVLNSSDIIESEQARQRREQDLARRRDYLARLEKARDQLLLAVAAAFAALLSKDTCSNLFHLPAGTSVLQFFAEVLKGSNRVRMIFADLGGPSPDGRITTATTAPFSNTQPNTALTRININARSPFLIGYSTSGFGDTEVENRAITLIHELGHAANFVFGFGSSEISNLDGAMPSLSIDNSRKVKINCF